VTYNFFGTNHFVTSALNGHESYLAVEAVVCLRGGERSTCLGPPFFGAPPWGVTRVHFP